MQSTYAFLSVAQINWLVLLIILDYVSQKKIKLYEYTKKYVEVKDTYLRLSFLFMGPESLMFSSVKLNLIQFYF